jgi:hypothetical protein
LIIGHAFFARLSLIIAAGPWIGAMPTSSLVRKLQFQLL